MKRTLSFIVALLLIISMIQMPVIANAADTQLKPLPKVGDVFSGFKTAEVGELDIINSKTALFTHEKTGAQLLYIQNEDTNRSFDITFKTPAVDNTGVNHILEHITVSGSKNYPLKNVLFTVANQTYSTFINAFTAQNFTTYPVSSMSEAQLMKLSEVYLDCAFQPSVYDDKNIFAREAWRYEMTDEKSPLTITGTVYNEMKGALGSISMAGMVNTIRTLYPDSVQSNISGGDPAYITDLTYEQLINTQKTYYHPSNSLMILYGNVDYEKFLQMINEKYLSKYDKKDIKIDDGKVTPANKKVSKTFKFPVSANSNTKNASEIVYAYAMTGISDVDSLGLSIYAALLSQPNSPLQKAFSQSKIGGSVSVAYDNSSVQPILMFSAQNADETKSAAFQDMVDKLMADTAKNGIDKDAIDAIISSVLLRNSNLTEQSNLPINISMAINQSWVITGKTDYLSKELSYIKDIRDRAKTGYIESLITKYISNNNHAALITTIPEAGLAEKQDNELKKKLADIKAKMSKAEIDKIIADTKAYTEWNNRKDDEKILASLKVVNVTDLPVEVKKYKVNDTTTTDGVRMLTAEANVAETEVTSVMLDTSGVPADKLHYLQLYSSLLGYLDTKNYSQQQLSTMSTRYLNGAGFYISTVDNKLTKQFTPYLTIGWLGLISEQDKQVGLVKEMLLNTNLDNSKEILSKVRNDISGIKASYANQPINMLISRNTALFDDSANYNSYISEIDYYNFLKNIEKTLTEKPETVVAELKAIKDLVNNKTGILTCFAGNKNNISKFETTIKTLTDALPAKVIAKQDYSKLPKPAKREGIALDTTVQYNMLSATYDKMGTSFNGKYIPVEAYLYEKYLTPKIRFGYGAYDNIVSFGSRGFFASSYRDPNIKETYDVYKGIADFIKNSDLTQAELDRFILQTFSKYTMPRGELSGAGSAIDNYLVGKTDEDRVKVLNEMKSLTVADVKAMATMFENLIKNGSYSTVGSSQKLQDNKDLFDVIITVDEAKEANTDNTSITRKQLFEALMPGVPNAFEVAKQQGLILGDGKGNYGEEDKLTRQQLATVICKLLTLYGKQPEAKDMKIADIDSADKWAKEQIKAVVGSGIMSLDDNGKFNPQGGITNAELQKVITNLVAKLQEK